MTFTLRGLVLVGLGACAEGKRMFLQEAGRRNVHRIGDRELDIITCGTTLVLPPKGMTWTEQDWSQLWMRLASKGYLGWLLENTIECFSPDRQHLVELLKDSDFDVRMAAAQSLSAHELDPAVQQHLVELLKE